MSASKKKATTKKSKSSKTKDSSDKGEPAAKLKNPEDALPEDPTALFYGVGSRSNVRRERFQQNFKDLVEVILASDPSRRGPLKDSSLANQMANSDDYFPTLQVGYVARAMGLNLDQSHVVFLVQLVENDDAPSSGSVSKSRLEAVLIDALMTNVLGGPTLTATGIIPPEKLKATPICVQKNSTEEIFSAFKALDTDNKGYIETEQLRAYLTSEGDRFTEDEIEEMLQALLDPETGHINYEEIAGILATE